MRRLAAVAFAAQVVVVPMAHADPVETTWLVRAGWGVASPRFHFGDATRIYQQPPLQGEQRMHGFAVGAAFELMPRPWFATTIELGVINPARPRAVTERVGAYYVHDRFRLGGGLGMLELQVSQEQESFSDHLTRWGPLVFAGGDVVIHTLDSARVVLSLQLDAARLCQPAGGSCWFWGPRRRRALIWNIYTATAAVGLRW